ncbi:MAG: hypothetical protein AAFY71_05755 [Bacteroidota bacterium]
MMRKILLLISMLGSTGLIAQKSFQATLVDPLGEPLTGVMIIKESTHHGAYSDFQGKVSMDVKKGDTLLISYIGFESLMWIVGKELNPTIELKPEDIELDKIEILGYANTCRGRLICCGFSRGFLHRRGIYAPFKEGRGLEDLATGMGSTFTSRQIIPNQNALSMLNGTIVPDYMALPGMDPILSLVNPEAIDYAYLEEGTQAQSQYGSRALNGVKSATLDTYHYGDNERRVYASAGINQGQLVYQAGIKNSVKLKLLSLQADVFQRKLVETPSAPGISLTQAKLGGSYITSNNRLSLSLLLLGTNANYLPFPTNLARIPSQRINQQLGRAMGNFKLDLTRNGSFMMGSSFVQDARSQVGHSFNIAPYVSFRRKKNGHRLFVLASGIAEGVNLREAGESYTFLSQRTHVGYGFEEILNVEANVRGEHFTREGEAARQHITGNVTLGSRGLDIDNCAPSRASLKMGYSFVRGDQMNIDMLSLKGNLRIPRVESLILDIQAFYYLPSESLGQESLSTHDPRSKWGSVTSLNFHKTVGKWQFNIKGKVATDQVAFWQDMTPAQLSGTIPDREIRRDKLDWVFGSFAEVQYRSINLTAGIQRAPNSYTGLRQHTFWETGNSDFQPTDRDLSYQVVVSIPQKFAFTKDKMEFTLRATNLNSLTGGPGSHMVLGGMQMNL